MYDPILTAHPVHSIFPISAVVITPSIGRPELAKCVESVQRQTFPNVRHLVVADGPTYAEVVATILKASDTRRHHCHFVTTPNNTGMSRYNGYRICTAFTYIVNEDIVFFLDDDNWFEPHHIESCIQSMLQFNTDWAYTLRRICKANGDLLVDDDCDSLGYWRRYASYQGPSDNIDIKYETFYSAYPFLIDTNCFSFKRTFLTPIIPLFLNGDAFLSNHLVLNFRGACTGLRTLNYGVSIKNEESRSAYFTEGNRSMERRYCGRLPWYTAQVQNPLGIRETFLPIRKEEQVDALEHPDRSPL